MILVKWKVVLKLRAKGFLRVPQGKRKEGKEDHSRREIGMCNGWGVWQVSGTEREQRQGDRCA